MIELRLLPLNAHIWKQYTMFRGARGMKPPTIQPDGVWVGLSDWTLVAGVLLYPTPGEYVFAENLVTNPMAPARLRHGAVNVVIDGVLRYAAMRGKHPFVIVRHRSIAKMLQKWGFVTQPGVAMSALAVPVVAQIKVGRQLGGNQEAADQGPSAMKAAGESLAKKAPRGKASKS